MDQENHARIASGVSMVAGLWLIISPFMLGYFNAPLLLWNSIVFGAIVAILALVKLAMPAKEERLDWINFMIGLWLILSAFIFGYTSSAVLWNNLLLGIILTAATMHIGIETRPVKHKKHFVTLRSGIRKKRF